MSGVETVRRTTVTTASWEPCITSDGRTIGEAHWIRRRGEGRQRVMLWRCEPMTFDYEFPGDESFHVLEGEVQIALKDTDKTIVLRSGDVASFTKGTRSTWTILARFKKFTVVSG